MQNLITAHPIALSLLLNEDIYVFKKETLEKDALVEETTSAEVEINEQKAEETVIPEAISSFKYLGENNQYVLVIVKDDEAEFLNETDKIFLLKILAAKKLELKDIAILNIAKQEACTFENLKSFFACNRILTFGINPSILKMEGLKSNVAQEYNGVKFLGTWSLRQMVNDDAKKRTYWQVLKSF